MAAPLNIKLNAQAGNANAGNSGSPIGHGIGAQSNVLQVLCILAQNNSTSSVPSVSSVVSDNGLTWHLLKRTTNTVDNAFSPGPVNDTTQVIEVWWTYGAVTNGGTWAFTLDRTVDGWTAIYSAYTGANASNPFDLGVNALLNVEHQANSDTIVTATTDTSQALLCAFFGRSANSNAGNPAMSSGAVTDSAGAGNFSSTNNMRSQFVYKTSTGGHTGVNVGYSTALGNGPVTNYSGVVFAVTADSQAVNGNATGDTVSVTATVTPGTASAANPGNASGATVTTTASLTPGSASGIDPDGDASGAIVAVTASLTPGTPTGGASPDGNATGATLTVTATLSAGRAGGLAVVVQTIVIMTGR